MTPELPSSEVIPNPYTYTEYAGSQDRHRARSEDVSDVDAAGDPGSAAGATVLSTGRATVLGGGAGEGTAGRD